AKALDGDGVVAGKAQLAGKVTDEVKAAARGGVIAAQRTAQGDRLAGDDGGGNRAGDLVIFVAHPTHDHGIGVDVGRGNIAVRADRGRKSLHIGTRQALQL